MESPKSINKRIDAFFISNKSVADRRTDRHQVLFIQIDVIARVIMCFVPGACAKVPAVTMTPQCR